MANTPGALLKKLINARNAVAVANEVLKSKKEKYNELADQMIKHLQEANITITGSSAVATASLRETVVASVVDWEQFYRYIHRYKNYQLLQKRVSDGVYREIMETRKNKDIPGTKAFTKIALSLRIGGK